MTVQQQIEKRLKDHWRIDEFRFIGRYSPLEKVSFFNDLRNEDGDQLRYPHVEGSGIAGGPASVFSPRKLNLKAGEYYQFNAEVNPMSEKLDKTPLIIKSQPFGLVSEKVKERLEKEELIKRIFRDTAPNERVARNQANAIKKVTEDAYEENERFIYELIQNADDASNHRGVKLSFAFQSGYILVIHNGEPFSKDDVESITSIGYSGQTKARKIQKTGYKGIGFKAVFIVSDRVAISSGGYNFEFNKDHDLHKVKKWDIESIPWEIQPIWLEKYRFPSVLKDHIPFVNDITSFIVKLKNNSEINSDSVEGDAIRIFSEARFTLFLRNISSISLDGQNGQIQIHKRQNDRSATTELYINEDIDSQWQTWTTQVDIDEEVSESIQDDSVTPKKLKEASQVSISFAALINNNAIKTLKGRESVLFTYLPTSETEYEFPYLVNADFLTILNRQKIHKNKRWNRFLFFKIGFLQFQWVTGIWKTNNPMRFQMMKLLRAKFSEEDVELYNEFNNGFDLAIEGLSFIPDSEGELQNLTEILFDETGLSSLLDIEDFQNLAGTDKFLVHPELSPKKFIKQLIQDYDKGEIFNWQTLVDTVDDLTEWLWNPEQNLAFIKLLIEANKLDDFEDQKIFLDQNGVLKPASEVYYSFNDDDLKLLGFLNISVLNKRLCDHLSEEELSLQHYTPANFLKEVICQDINSIDKAIETKADSISFFTYLSKYSSKLDNEVIKELMNLKFHCATGDLSDSLDGRPHYFFNTHLLNLLEERIFPSGWYYLLSPDYFDSNATTIDFWKKLGVIDATGTAIGSFLKNEIVEYTGQLNESFEKVFNEDPEQLNRSHNALLRYYYTNLKSIPEDVQEEIEKALGDFKTVTKSGGLEHFRNCYLSEEYTGNGDIEELSNAFPDLQFHFLSEEFINDKSLSPSNWRQLFKRIGVRYDHFQFTKSDLIPKISSLTEEQVIPATRLIFKYRVNLKESMAELRDFPIMTFAGKSTAKDVILGNHYQENPKLDTLLVNQFELPNEVHTDYSDRNLPEWKAFFESLGVPLDNEKLIADKLSTFLNQQDEYQKWESHSSMVTSIYGLYQDGFLDGARDLLKIMELRVESSKDDESFHQASQIFFSKPYKPIIDFDRLKPTKELVFLSPEYLQILENLNGIKKFFRLCGVKDSYSFQRVKSAGRDEVDESYLNHIDEEYEYIKSNAVNYASQHTIMPWIEVPHLELIQGYDFANLFWDKVAKDEKFRNAIFNKLEYKCAFKSNEVITYPLFFILHNAVMPAIDGTLRRPSHLFSQELSNVLEDDAKILGIDLEGLENEEGETILSLLGIRAELDLAECLLLFAKEKPISWLREKGIIRRLGNILENIPDDYSASKLSDFISNGQLPCQTGEYRSVSNLHYLKDFDIGIAKSQWLVHDDLIKLAEAFDLSALSREDFKFSFEVSSSSQSFKPRLLQRRKYFAIAEKLEEWESVSLELLEKIRQLTFHSVQQISLTYEKDRVQIFKKDFEFYFEEPHLYYLGNWDTMTASEMHVWLKDKHLKLKMPMKDYHQILLGDSDGEVISYLEANNIEIPSEWLVQAPSPESRIEEKLGRESTQHSDDSKRRRLLERAISESEGDVHNEIPDIASPDDDGGVYDDLDEEFGMVSESGPDNLMRQDLFDRIKEDAGSKKVKRSRGTTNERKQGLSGKHGKAKPSAGYSTSDKRKMEIGEAGEYFVYHLLQSDEDIEDLKWLSKFAEKHNKVGRGDDSLGYDMTYIDKSDGRLKYVEVKSTTFEEVSFHLSKNEYEVGCEKGMDYLIYMVTNVELDSRAAIQLPHLFSEEYDFSENDHFSVLPDGYIVYDFNIEDLDY